MKIKLIPFALMTGVLVAGAFGAFAQNSATTTNNLKYGLYIHFGITTFANPGEQGQIPAERFAPATPLDERAWAHAAREAGMTSAVLTAKHESGFCLWDSPGYGYDEAQSPFRHG